MTCASCANFMERALARTPGIQSAQLHLATEKATVAFSPGLTDRAGLKAAVEAAGYHVAEAAAPTPLGQPNAGVSDEELAARKALAYAQLRRRFGVAAILAALIMPLSMLMLGPALMPPVAEPALNYGRRLLTLPAPRHGQHGHADCGGHGRGVFV